MADDRVEDDLLLQQLDLDLLLEQSVPHFLDLRQKTRIFFLSIPFPHLFARFAVPIFFSS